jgi:four helix bundle protein
MTNKGTKYDLSERTSTFGKNVIVFARKFKIDTINRSLLIQIIRSATSIGANYMEADCAESKKDFRHKIGICKKESKETGYWLHMLSISNPEKTAECRTLWKESHEFTLIFSSIIKNCNLN